MRLSKECTAGLSNSCKFLFPAIIKQGSFWIQVQNGDAVFWTNPAMTIRSLQRFTYFLGIDFKLAWMQRIIIIVFLATNWVNHLSSVSRPELIRAIVDCGFEHPSEVQHECIPQAGPRDMTKKGDRLDLPLTLWQIWKLIGNPTEHVILLVTGMTGMTGMTGWGGRSNGHQCPGHSGNGCPVSGAVLEATWEFGNRTAHFWSSKSWKGVKIYCIYYYNIIILFAVYT